MIHLLQLITAVLACCGLIFLNHVFKALIPVESLYSLLKTTTFILFTGSYAAGVYLAKTYRRYFRAAFRWFVVRLLALIITLALISKHICAHILRNLFKLRASSIVDIAPPPNLMYFNHLEQAPGN